MTKRSVDALIRDTNWASPPDLLFQIIDTLNSELTASQIGDIVGCDQSIAAQVMRLSNSSFFGFRGQVTTLERAISILGTKTVRNIAVTSLMVSYSSGLKLKNLNVAEFWLHTFLVADFARELSTSCDLNEGEAYITGLLHDTGKLLLYAQQQDERPELLEPHTRTDVLDYEHRMWGIDSTDVTTNLLRRWQLPDGIVTAIEAHRAPETTSKMANVIALADELSQVISSSTYQSELSEAAFISRVQACGLPMPQMRRFLGVLPRIVARGRQIMQLILKSAAPLSAERRQMVSLLTATEPSMTSMLLNIYGFDVDIVSPSRASEQAPSSPPQPTFRDMTATTKTLMKLFGRNGTPLAPAPPRKHELKWADVVVADCVSPEPAPAGALILEVSRHGRRGESGQLPFLFSLNDIEMAIAANAMCAAD